ncbi:unnamed protein product, partial [Meganyctiphanes norvegica]
MVLRKLSAVVKDKRLRVVFILSSVTLLYGFFGENFLISFSSHSNKSTYNTSLLHSDLSDTASPVSKVASPVSKVVQKLEKRREHVHKMCESNWDALKHRQSISSWRFFHFYDYNTSVCTIAKAGSSTWRAHLRRVNGGPPRTLSIKDDARRDAFNNRPLPQVIADLMVAQTIVTVRHPLTRLVSAYKNKYQGGRIMPSHNRKLEEALR